MMHDLEGQGRVAICEVGPRDGLQNHPRQFSVDERVEMINRLIACGLTHVEAVSFVNDKKVPRMAGAEDVLAGVDRRPGVRIAGLVLNERGAERALKSGVDEVRFVIVASETFSRRNQGAGVAETVAAFTRIAAPVRQAGRGLTAVIATAFGCPFEGRINPSEVVRLAGEAAGQGAHEVILADTIGAATPFEIARLVPQVAAAVGAVPMGCHFHNTRNLGFANAFAALQCGARLLDASIGGLGGCPFAPRATGNIPTEDLVFMLRDGRLAGRVDLTRVFELIGWIEEKTGQPVPGLLSRAGAFPEIAMA